MNKLIGSLSALLVISGTPSAYAQSEVLSKVKAALASCEINNFFAVKSAISDTDKETQSQLVKFFAERTKARSKCDAGLAVLGLELLDSKSAPAVPDLMKAAIESSKQADILNGPAPRLSVVLYTLRAVVHSSPEGRVAFFSLLPTLGSEDEKLMLASAAVNASGVAPQVLEKLQPIWKDAISRTESQIAGAKLKSSMSDGRLKLTQLTRSVFPKTLPLREIVIAVNATTDPQLKTELLTLVSSAPEGDDVLVEMKKIQEAGLDSNQKALLYSSSPALFSEKLAAHRKTYKLEHKSACTVGKQKFELEETLPKLNGGGDGNGGSDGDYDNEGSTIWLKVKGKSALLLGFWNIPSVPFNTLNATKGSKSACAGISAFKNGSTLIVPIVGDDRPFGQNIHFAFIDSKTMKLMDVLSASGQFPDKEIVHEDAEGLSFLTTIQPTDSAVESKITVRGQTADRVEDGVLPLVNRLRFEGHTGKLSIDQNKTWEKFPHKNFFKNVDEFAKRFDLNEYPIQWVRIAVKDKKPYCIYPSRTRNLPANDRDWICL